MITPMTYMCDNGYHGTTERIAEFRYEGSCAGVVRSIHGTRWNCPCACHNHIPTVTKMVPA